MAKKRSASADGLNVSAAIRDALQENPAATGRECLEAVQAKYPGANINEKSFQVAYSVTRRKMGLGKGRAKVRRKKPGRGPALPSRTIPTAAASVTFEQLQLAADFVAKIGSPSAAVAAVNQVAKLQIR